MHHTPLLFVPLLSMLSFTTWGQTAAPPYDLKGDQLGMRLIDFKTKYHHIPTGDPKPAPFCSDEYPDADVANTGITLPHGIVACKIFFPFEEREGPKGTIASVPVLRQVFYFIDGKLFTIDTIFDAKNFDDVLSAFQGKYHSPNSSETKIYQNVFGASFEGKISTWQNGVSFVSLTQFSEDLTHSRVLFVHDTLSKEAEARFPKAKPDL